MKKAKLQVCLEFSHFPKGWQKMPWILAVPRAPYYVLVQHVLEV